MSEPGDKVARRYRELAREEPPRALDDAILAASRREVGAGPQRARSGVSRWAGPVSIAAVLVLGIGVSLRMQLEKPGIESSLPASPPAGEYPLPPSAEPVAPHAAPPSPPAQQAPAAAPAQPAPAQSAPAPRTKAAAPQAQLARPEPKPEQATPLAKRLEAPAERMEAPARRADTEMARNRAPGAPLADAPIVLQAPPAPAAPPAAAIEPTASRAPSATGITSSTAAGAAPAPPQAPMRAKREGFAADSAARESRAIAAAADPDPAREVERIARLREAGRHAEADRALEDLRRRHPDFRIPDAMWERVKPR